MQPLRVRAEGTPDQGRAPEWTVLIALTMGIASLALIFMIFWL